MPAHAQKWTVGLKGGIGQASFTGQQEFEWKPGALSIVGFLNRTLTSRLSIQPELYETQRIGTSTAGGGDLTFNAHYVDFPVLLRYRLLDTKLRPFVEVGPTLSFVATCGLSFVAPGIASNFECGDAANTFDYGGTAGAGISWTVGGTTFTVEGRGTANVRSVVLSSKSSRGIAYAGLAGVSVPLSRLRRRPVLGTVPGQSGPGRLPLPDAAGVALGPATIVPPAESGTAVAGQRVTLNAVGADARTLLVEIAKNAGINLVVSEDVRRRVTVALNDAPADEAIRAIISQAGLSVVQPATPQMPPVVFYQLPVNVNEASVAAIQARFGVSKELAQYIADSRAPKQP